MHVRDISGQQGRLVVYDSGPPENAPTVVLVHCDCGAHGQWRDTVAYLRRERRTIAFDLRGHGASAAPADGDYSFAGRADDVGAVLDTLDLLRVVLVGHSGGAITAMHYAASNPDRVAGLLLVDPPSDGRQFPESQRLALLEALRSPRWKTVLCDYYASIAGPNETVRSIVLGDAAQTPQETVVGVFLALGSYDPEPALRGYAGPRLSLGSEGSDQPAALHRLVATLPHKMIRGTHHWLHLEDPAAFQKYLRAFLADC
jgi:pimeloyl-ACP methyl ester carboxylesterase